MTTPTVARAPRSHPDHYDEHVRLAQAVDWDRPRGIIGYTVGSTTSGTIAGGNVPVTVFTLTNLALKAGRFYLISFTVRAIQCGGTAGYFRGLPYYNVGAGDVNLGGMHIYLQASAQWQHMNYAFPHRPAADATTTIKLNLDSNVGGSYWTDRGGHLKVDDLGPDRGGQ